MNQLLQKSTRALCYSFTHNNFQLSVCARTKKTDALSSTTARGTSNVDTARQQSVNSLSKITLIQPNQSIIVTTLKEAQKLAKRRELHLVKQQDFDTKTQRSIYKLVTATEMLSEDVDESAVDRMKSSEKKSEKSLTIGSRISDHDLESRLKHISKWLAKNHEVCILVQGSPEEMAKCEQIFKTIEQSVKEPEVIGRVVQKRGKGSHIKFTIRPVPKLEPETEKQA
ncbi:translation initiation factor IF-3 isoform X1 [Rhagoletis pomonella]|uniref:translation initiation factor IF-3 isoform X1 n=1 Tax=Rhagoletis pomonella TaxID=28610 RepID=UPI00177CEB6F|nr:translation initiation factor IF-3 isoform X1 [Rhagoletis pomonella]